MAGVDDVGGNNGGAAAGPPGGVAGRGRRASMELMVSSRHLLGGVVGGVLGEGGIASVFRSPTIFLRRRGERRQR